MDRAGYEVSGVDIVDQPRYPFQFQQGDAIEASLNGFDFVWASPPCQRYSRMSQCRPRTVSLYPDLIGAIRQKLKNWGGCWVIENVAGAPLRDPIMLCGMMFDLKLYRHRYFESSHSIFSPPHPPHSKPASRAGHWIPGTICSVAGNCAPIALAREAMGINWMMRDELAEAIPPAFSEYIVRHFARLPENGITGAPTDRDRLARD